jgi:sec-independent protein translocase protein TatA
MFGLKGTELLLILVVLLLLFGSTRLPQLGSSLGSAIRNFKKGFNGEGEEVAPERKGGSISASAGTDANSSKEKVREG